MSVGAMPPGQQLVAVSRQGQRPSPQSAAAVPRFTCQPPYSRPESPELHHWFPPAIPNRRCTQAARRGLSNGQSLLSNCPCRRAKRAMSSSNAKVLDVRVAADDAGGRTGRVEQDAVERGAVEPRFRAQGAARAERLAFRPCRARFASNRRRARAIHVQGYHLSQVLAGLQQLRGLAAGRRAGRRAPRMPGFTPSSGTASWAPAS